MQDCTSGSGSQSPALSVGDTVLLQGLQGSAWLNGRVGKLAKWEDATGRWQVDLGEAGMKALLPKNLEVLQSKGEEAAPGSTGGETSDQKVTEGGDCADKPDAEDENKGADASSNTCKSSAASSADAEKKTSDTKADPEIDFAKMSVKELKKFLQDRGVAIPGSVAEKSDLVDLVRRAAELPVRPGSSQDNDQGSSTKTSSASGQPGTGGTSTAAGATGAGNAHAWNQPGFGWGWAPPKAPPMGGTIPGLPTGPPYGPSWGFGHSWPYWQPFPGQLSPGMTPPFANTVPAPAAANVGVPKPKPCDAPSRPPKWPPLTYQDALMHRDYRLWRIRLDPSLLQEFRRFCQMNRICDDVARGIQMLGETGVRHFMSDRDVASRLQKARDPHDVVVEEATRRDQAAGTVIRLLVPASAPSEQVQPDCARSRSRHGRRRRRRHRSRRSASAERTPSPQGVWQESADPVAAPADDGFEAAAEELHRWLLQLDSGRGALECYFEALQKEFGSLSALPACVLPDDGRTSIVGRIDASLWEALQVKSLGHRLLLAKGILALE